MTAREHFGPELQYVELDGRWSVEWSGWDGHYHSERRERFDDVTFIGRKILEDHDGALETVENRVAA